MNEIQFCYWLRGFFDRIAAGGIGFPDPFPPEIYAAISAKLDPIMILKANQGPIGLRALLVEMQFVIKYELPVDRLEALLDNCFTEFIIPQSTPTTRTIVA